MEAGSVRDDGRGYGTAIWGGGTGRAFGKAVKIQLMETEGSTHGDSAVTGKLRDGSYREAEGGASGRVRRPLSSVPNGV